MHCFGALLCCLGLCLVSWFALVQGCFPAAMTDWLTSTIVALWNQGGESLQAVQNEAVIKGHVCNLISLHTAHTDPRLAPISISQALSLTCIQCSSQTTGLYSTRLLGLTIGITSPLYTKTSLAAVSLSLDTACCFIVLESKHQKSVCYNLRSSSGDTQEHYWQNKEAEINNNYWKYAEDKKHTERLRDCLRCLAYSNQSRAKTSPGLAYGDRNLAALSSDWYASKVLLSHSVFFLQSVWLADSVPEQKFSFLLGAQQQID